MLNVAFNYCAILPFLRVLPVDAFLEVVKFFGAASFMDTYVGKETNSLIHQNGSSWNPQWTFWIMYFTMRNIINKDLNAEPVL